MQAFLYSDRIYSIYQEYIQLHDVTHELKSGVRNILLRLKYSFDLLLEKLLPLHLKEKNVKLKDQI